MPPAGPKADMPRPAGPARGILARGILDRAAATLGLSLGLAGLVKRKACEP